VKRGYVIVLATIDSVYDVTPPSTVAQFLSSLDSNRMLAAECVESECRLPEPCTLFMFNKKLCYHASVVLSWCTLTFLGKISVDG